MGFITFIFQWGSFFRFPTFFSEPGWGSAGSVPPAVAGGHLRIGHELIG